MQELNVSKMDNTALGRAWSYLGGTIILGRITASSANEIAAFVTIAAGMATTIFTCLKIYEWLDKWKLRRRYNKVHKIKKQG